MGDLRPPLDEEGDGGCFDLVYSAFACSIRLCLCSYAFFSAASFWVDVMVLWW